VGPVASWAWDFGDGNTSTSQNPTHSFPAMGTYTVCLVATSPCGGTSSVCQVVNACAVPAVTGQPQAVTVCEGVSTSYSVAATGDGLSYQWQYDPGTGFVNASGTPYSGETTTTLSVAATTTGMNSYKYRCVVSGTCGTENSDTVLLAVNALPSVSFSALGGICQTASTFTLTGGSPAGGTYSGTAVSAGSFDPATSGVGTFTLTYTYTDGNTCTNSANSSITVNPTPTVSLASFSNVCANTPSFTLTGGAPSGGTYSGTGVSTGNFDAASAGVGTYTITYTYTDGNSCSNSTTGAITVNATPTVSLGSFTSVCVSALSFTLGGESPAGGTFSGTGVSSGSFDPATAGAGTHTVTYSYTDGNACTNTATSPITVNALPVVTLGSFSDVCVSAPSFTLGGESPSGGTFSGTGVSSGSFDPATAGTGTFTITYSYTDADSCSNTAASNIAVNVLPAVTLGTFANVCVTDAAFVLTGGSPSGGTYSGTGVSGGSFDPATAGVATHTITYTYTDGNSCSNSAQQTILVDVCTGLSQAVGNAFSIYPNPTSGNITIAIGSTHISLEIYDAVGKMVRGAELKGITELNLDGLKPGLYTFKLSSTNGFTLHKVVIQ
jgi:hypothetical protein